MYDDTSKNLADKTCLLGIDVEDWFHLVGVGLDYQFRGETGGIASWDDRELRVDYTTRWILDLLDRHQTRATFFILGWVADRFPELIAEIHNRGHEIASHSYWHRLVYQLTPKEFQEDLRRSIDVLQNITGEKVYGFRASTASIADWAIEIIAEEGLVYDSSLFPAMYHDVYGTLSDVDPKKPIVKLPNGLWEVKFSSLRLGKRYMPWSGGGYFRLLPYPIFKWGINRILNEDDVFQFYIHPWEFESSAPRLDNLKFQYKYRRYVGLEKMPAKMNQLLNDFSFMPVIEYIRKHEEAITRV